MEETKLLRPKAEVRMAVLKVMGTPRALAIPAELLAINPAIVRKDQRDRLSQRTQEEDRLWTITIRLREARETPR